MDVQILRQECKELIPCIPTEITANIADPDERARKEPSHLDLLCLPFCYRLLIETPICNNGCVKIFRWKSPCQKLRGEREGKYST